jgi:nicotinamidase-related amidase
MAVTNHDLHGNVPDSSGAALLLIDVINDFEFDGGEQLLEQALPVGRNIARLKQQASEIGIPSIYVNDNFGKWQSDFRKIIAHCREDDVRGKPFVEMLLPNTEDYFVLKPKHSGFYSTTLDLLLKHLTATNLILTGIAGNNCVLFTANDAYMRDFKLFVPSDCTVSIDPKDNEYALRQMKEVLKADIRPGVELDLEEIKTAGQSDRLTSSGKAVNTTPGNF